MNDIIRHLQSADVKKNLLLRRKLKAAAESILLKEGFGEYDTPVLVPKGGEKYNPTFDVAAEGVQASLADSPQLFKMLLCMAGYDRYYQFAHCFRPIEHESNKHTRLCEFTQLDIEMKAGTLAELTGFAVKLITGMIDAAGGSASVCHISGTECRNLYGDEMKPDLRMKNNEISVVIIERMPLTNGERTSDGGLIPCHHIFALPSAEITSTSEESLTGSTTESFDIVINGIEVGGGDLRIRDRNVQERLMDIFDVDKMRYGQYLEILDSFGSRQGGGFAIGIERLAMALSDSGNIRDTVLFPDFYKL